MSRGRSMTALGAIAAVALVFGATCCTTGDGEDEVKTDDGGDAAAVIAAAIDDARASSGRYHTVITVVTGDDAGNPAEMTQTGEFSEDSSLVESDLSEQIGGGDVETVHTAKLQVGGRTYGATAALEGLNITTSPDDDYDLTAVAGKEWIDITELVPEGALNEVDVDPFAALYVLGWISEDPFELLGRITAIAETSSDGIDGEPTRHFTATLPADQVLSLVFGEPVGLEDTETSDDTETPSDGDTGWDRRQAIVERYLDEQTSVTVDLDLDAHDQLRRIRVESTTSIEEQFEDCPYLYAPYDSLTIATDFSDLGSEIVVDAPDPNLVMPLDEFVAAFPNSWSDSDQYDDSESAYEQPSDAEGPEVETVDGPRQRDAVVNDLSKFGYVIGLVPDPWISDPDRTAVPSPHVYAEAVASLSDEELVAKYAEADAVLAAMPRTTTALGDLTRPELLWNVKVGMRNLAIDLTVADGLSDEQLGGVIDSYVAENGWIVGDGIWGDMSQELLDSFHADSIPEPEDFGATAADIEEEFEGCPS